MGYAHSSQITMLMQPNFTPCHKMFTKYAADMTAAHLYTISNSGRAQFPDGIAYLKTCKTL